MLPLVICCGPRALPTAALASAYYAADGVTSIVVRPRDYRSHDDRFAAGTRFIDDEALAGVEEVRRFLVNSADALARFNRAPGWFLQQFIKLAAVCTLDAPFTFIADGDTIFSHDLLRTVLRKPTVLTTGETYGNYDRLLVAMGLAPPPLSCVANGNVFAPGPVLQELAKPAGFEAVLRDHVLPSGGALDFSEYQITGSLLEPRIGSRRIRMFRRFDLLIRDIEDIPQTRVERALRRYDAVAIEANHHRSAAKRAAAHLFYGAGRSW